MISRAANPRCKLLASLWRRAADDRASQIVEFALSLPLLVVFAVGIFDFSGAVSLKQKLTNAAREGARAAAADPANDLGGTALTAPASVTDALFVVDTYLSSENINDCGLVVAGNPAPTPAKAALTWTYTSQGTCPGNGITLAVNRGCVAQENGVKLIATCVTITYPYKWYYSNLAGLTGGTFAGPSNLTTTATALNEN